MNSMEDQYVFDTYFVSEVPDYLKCVVCHLVLRQPIQIMKCGHRFCEPYFERLKGYSRHMQVLHFQFYLFCHFLLVDNHICTIVVRC